jgi:hypothetical protein
MIRLLVVRRLVVLGALACGIAAPAAAHPGHGAPELESSWLHYVAEPEHAFVLVALVLVSSASISVWARRRARAR